MKRIAACFANARSQNRAALVCYITGGDPSLGATIELATAIAEAGADIIEIGLPFSDSIADGATIQASSQRALAAGASVERVLNCIETIRGLCDTPLVAMTYCNPVERYGLDQFARDAHQAGLDGVIMTDMPPEESRDWIEIAHGNGLDTVFLVAPTSTTQRLKAAARASTGFLYCVSRLGVTGVRRELPTDLEDLVQRARAVARCPVCVGFGISTPEHVRAVSRIADGVVVGSALVSAIAEQTTDHQRVVRARELVKQLAAATHRDG